jgi:transposase
MTAEYYVKQAQHLVAKQRLQWIKEYETLANVNEVCRRFGISRKTFYKWLRRYEETAGDVLSLVDHSRTPRSHPTKTEEAVRMRILQIRSTTGFGPRRIASQLQNENIHLSTRTIWKILREHENGSPVRRERKSRRLQISEIPGDCIQLGIKNITHFFPAFKAVQYSAIDSASRYRFVRFYPMHSTLSALDFVQQIRAAFPFPIRTIRTRIDTVFTSLSHPGSATHAFTANLAKEQIRHTISNGVPETKNRKLERAHTIDEEEFFPFVSCSTMDELQKKMDEYISQYNRTRKSAALGNMSPEEFLRHVERNTVLNTVTAIG